MAINRRQFIKRSAGAVSVSLIMPRFWMGGVAQGQEIAAEGFRCVGGGGHDAPCQLELSFALADAPSHVNTSGNSLSPSSAGR